MAITLSDIAQELGLSEATVSLALNNKSVVNEKTRERVCGTAVKMGYLPNANAQGLAKKSTKLIGVVVPDITNPYYGELVKQCGEHIRLKGYSPLFAFSNDSRSLEEQIIDQFISERVDGIIIAPTNKEIIDADYTVKLCRNNIKHIFVTSYYQNLKSPYVMVNLKNGSYQLIKYLLDLGHKDIYFLSCNPEMIPTLTRIEGYKEAFCEYGFEVDNSKFIECSSVTFEQAFYMTEQLISSGKNIDAIVAMNDMMALGALRSLMNNGIRIPEDISLAGYDDVVFSNVSAIPLTTVKQNISQMSTMSVDMLVRIIEGSKEPSTLMIEPELVVRKSTGRAKKNK